MKNIFSKLKKPRYFVPIGGVALVGSVFAFSGGGGAGDIETQIVQEQTVRQTINEVGTVEAAEDIALSFGRTDRIAEIRVREGQHVSRGHVLARLLSGGLSADLNQALAQLEREYITLEELQAGATTEERAVSNAAVFAAKTELENTRRALRDQVQNTLISADSTIRTRVDQLFNSPTTNPSFGTTITQGNKTYHVSADINERIRINSLRKRVSEEEEELEQLLNASSIDVIVLASQAEGWLTSIQELLDEIAEVVNSYTPDDTNSQTIYGGYQSDIATARTGINSDISQLRADIRAYRTAQASLESVERTQEQTTAGARPEQIRIQEIRIREAQSRVDSVYALLGDAQITSPISGVITSIDASVGETIGAGTPVISVISDTEHHVTVYIPEADIANINVGDGAEVTFDAYDDASFEAHVVFSAQTATIVDSVPSFEIVLEFDESDERIRAGLSADAEIFAEERVDVLAVPSRAFFEEGGVTYVRVVETEGSFKRREVKRGLRGSNGLTEVISGLEAGEEVITYISEETLARLTEEK